MSQSRETHAVVLGGGLAGMLAASVLARHVDRVTVVERDRLPAGPELRRGVPQARHAHLLMAGGARGIDELVPGTIDRLLGAGAHKVGMPEDVVSMSAYGWQHRFPATQFVITCSREFLDWTVRDQALREPKITVHDQTEIVELCGDAQRITGVRIRPKDGEEVTALDADVVVNATGRGSPMKRWFAELGLPEVREDVVDTGIAYATRVFRAPEGARDRFPLVVVYADHRAPRPGQNAALVPIEGGRWIVTLSGTRGGEPSTDEDSFQDFARGIRDPIVAKLIAMAEPLTPVQGSRSTANRRVRYEEFTAWPDGFVVLGDALAAFNPVHGHGMSAAAHGAKALDRQLRRYRFKPGMAGRAQRAIGSAVDDAWMLATSLDICYPDCDVQATDPRLAQRGAEGRSFTDLLGTTALREPVVSAAAIDVNTLSAPLASLESAHVVAALRRGPKHPPLTEPPLTEREQALLALDATSPV